MANAQRNNNVWVIDTATVPPALVTTQLVSISGIRWVGTLAGAGGAQLTNAAGEVIWAASGATGVVTEESNDLNLQLIGGFGVPTLAAGTVLYVYLVTRSMR